MRLDAKLRLLYDRHFLVIRRELAAAKTLEDKNAICEREHKLLIERLDYEIANHKPRKWKTFKLREFISKRLSD